MKKIIFYSWQSDLPNSTNRGFIQQALEKAATIISSDDTVAVEPVVDRDTQGVAGAPDIASTIFAKITASDIFVADISIIARPRNGRPMPNPNVLIELGYAFRALGQERVILVFNRSYGKIEELPFDLRMRRLVSYDMKVEEENRAPEKSKLEKQLEIAIRSALEEVPEPEIISEAIPAILALENNQPNRIIVLRKNLSELLQKIDDNQPTPHSEGGTVENLKESINATQELIAEFSKIVETVAIMKDEDAAVEIYKWFGNIFERYDYPPNTNGRISNADHDYFKFVGHEMFVTMIALYIREQKLDILKEILSQAISIKYLRNENGPVMVYWDYASEHLPLLLDESKVKNRLSIHADILENRHTIGGLSTIMPMEEFDAADFFLFLLGEVSEEQYDGPSFKWRPWSVLYMKHIPMFIKNAEQKGYAQKLIEIFNVASIDEFKKRLKERYKVVTKLFQGGFWHIPNLDEDIEKIATH